MKRFGYNMNIPSAETFAASRSAGEVSNLVYILSVAKRRKWYLALGVAAGLFAGSAYLALAKHTFTGTCLILIESPSKGGIPGTPDTSASAIDATDLESQVEVIRSWQVADVVIKNLSPDERDQLAKEYRPTSFPPVWLHDKLAIPKPASYLPAWMPSTSPTIKAAADDPVGNSIDLNRVLRALSVTRMERTYVLSISFTATDPKLAANVANGFASAYREFLHDRRVAIEQSKKNWIQQRLDEVRVELLQSDKDLQTSQVSPAAGAPDAVKRELDWNSQTQKFYQSLLQARREISDGSFGEEYFHVITPSDPSSTHRSPSLSLAIVLSLVAGLAGGSVAAALSEAADRSFRTRGQVEDLLAARFLGWLPVIGKKSKLNFASDKILSGGPLTYRLPAILRVSTDRPQSPYAETLREIRACATLLPPRNEIESHRHRFGLTR